MKKYLFLIAISLMFSVTSCLDVTNDEEYQDYLRKQEEAQKAALAQYKTDSLLITQYLAEKQLPAVIDSLSGIFYHIEKPGYENHPNSYSTVTVNYKGYLLDGTVFDETPVESPMDFYLGTLIYGWQIGLSKIGADGRIILYIPSYYGYGTVERAKIPANSVLIFEIDLLTYF
jgi:FKBP-type peptidyl-prolyl cis-trans isomerase FkpA